MVDAVGGAVIMVVATTSLLLSVEVLEDGFRDAGRYPIKKHEENLLIDLESSLKALERDKSLVEAVTKMREDPDEFKRKVLNLLPKDFNSLEGFGE